MTILLKHIVPYYHITTCRGVMVVSRVVSRVMSRVVRVWLISTLVVITLAKFGADLFSLYLNTNGELNVAVHTYRPYAGYP